MSKKHGTASTGRVLEFILTVARNAPRDLPPEFMDAWDINGMVMRSQLRKALTSVRLIPADGVPFALQLDGDAPENQPMEVVRFLGYDPHLPNHWRHTGTKVVGKQTRFFQLVSVGPCPSFDQLGKKLAYYGENPEGQWITAFKKTFPLAYGMPIGIFDPTWIYPCDDHGDAGFPCIGPEGSMSFFWGKGRGFDHTWHWLIRAK